MSYLPNIDDNLIPSKVTNQFFREYIGATPLTGLMGQYKSKAIIQIQDLGGGGGMSAQYALMKSLDSNNVVYGYDQMEGKEQNATLYSDTIHTARMRVADQLLAIDVTKATTPIDVFNALRPLLLEAVQTNLVNSLFNSMTFDLYPNPDTQIPVYDRAVFCGAETDRGAWYANINAGIDAMAAGTAYNENGLSVDVIRDLVAIATSGGKSFEAERKICPTKIGYKNGFPEEQHVLLIGPKAYRQLVKDPEWQSQVNRGVVVSDMQPSVLSGARFKGIFEGVLIYVCPELDKYQRTFNGKTSSWGMLLGAQALGLVWSLRPRVKDRVFDYGNIGVCIEEYRGQKALMFPSKINAANMVENGIVHVFSRVA